MLPEEINVPCDMVPDDNLNIGYYPNNTSLYIGVDWHNENSTNSVVLQADKAKQVRDFLLKHFPIE